MDNSKYFFAAIAGWLLVSVSGTIEATLRFGHIFSPIAKLIAGLIAIVGWITTVVFSSVVIKEAWKSLRSR